MEQVYTSHKQTESALPDREAGQLRGPSMDALRSGAAQPTAEQMGHRVDLPDVMRAKMENAFGADLSAVRLYESQSVADAGAKAITRGSDIAFAPGMLDFTSYGGQSLLGHEISHVVSQARGEVTGGGFLNDHALESRADREGAMAAAGQQVAMPAAAMSPVSVAGTTGPMQAAGKQSAKEYYMSHGTGSGENLSFGARKDAFLEQMMQRHDGPLGKFAGKMRDGFGKAEAPQQQPIVILPEGQPGDEGQFVDRSAQSGGEAVTVLPEQPREAPQKSRSSRRVSRKNGYRPVTDEEFDTFYGSDHKKGSLGYKFDRMKARFNRNKWVNPGLAMEGVEMDEAPMAPDADQIDSLAQTAGDFDADLGAPDSDAIDSLAMTTDEFDADQIDSLAQTTEDFDADLSPTRRRRG